MAKHFSSENPPAAEDRLEQPAAVLLPPRGAGKGLQRALSSLRQRNFRLFWSGQSISLMGSSMQAIGQTWLVLEYTHSAWQVGLVGALQALPILLFSLFGGIFADRWPKRHMLLITQIVSTIQALLLWILIATHTLQLWHLYILVLLLGLASSLGRPASRAFIVELVGREDLPNAVAIYSSISTLSRIIGPGLGGIIIAASNVTALFLINALSFLPVIASLILLRNSELHTSEVVSEARSERIRKRQSTWQSLREGLLYVWNTPTVLLVIVVTGLVLLFGSNFNVVLPLIATDVLHMGAAAFGFLSAALSIGAFLSTLWLAWNNRRPSIRSLLLEMLLFGALEVIFAFSHLYLLSLALIALVGFSEMWFATQALTMLQTITPDHLNGRVLSVQVLLFDGSLPLGYLLLGWLSTLYGPSLALLIGAALTLLVAGIGWIMRKPAEIQSA